MKKNLSIISKEFESVTENLTKKSPGPDGFIGASYEAFKVELISIFLKLFQKKLKKREYLQTHSMKSAL